MLQGINRSDLEHQPLSLAMCCLGGKRRMELAESELRAKERVLSRQGGSLFEVRRCKSE